MHLHLHVLAWMDSEPAASDPPAHHACLLVCPESPTSPTALGLVCTALITIQFISAACEGHVGCNTESLFYAAFHLDALAVAK